MDNIPSCPVTFTFTAAKPQCLLYIRLSHFKYSALGVCVCKCMNMYEQPCVYILLVALQPQLSEADLAVAFDACGQRSMWDHLQRTHTNTQINTRHIQQQQQNRKRYVLREERSGVGAIVTGSGAL